MIKYKKYHLDNGLRVIIHKDKSTPIVAVNLAFDVGARDEDPNITGLAHYFEHLMFSGSKNAPDYDVQVQNAGGQNNAFTTNDYTNYYLTLPKNNLELALWLEADRMFQLNLDEKSLEVQRQVVIEEFKQRYLNQPYGNNLAQLRKITYKDHPYKWATIGQDISHIEKVTLKDAMDFYKQFYAPNNCILSICGDVDYEKTFNMVKKWFADIPPSTISRQQKIQEREQKGPRAEKVEEPVPLNAFLWSFKIGKRTDSEFPLADLTSDILGRDESSLLHQKLAVELKLVSNISAYVTGDRGPGMLVISGKVNDGVEFEQVEKEIWKIINELKEVGISNENLLKVKNKFETAHVYGEMNVMNKAMNLGYAELCNDVEDINRELLNYQAVKAQEIQIWVQEKLTENAQSKLHVIKTGNGQK
ncbi:MAG: peptidase M16 [Flavobacteriales bacterium]|nr:peptidase M16 [Flavobacteriales bacterium]|tara:strand:- start:560 stop:1810 length:1251 start_codon:yes stop_codon:yes gene_type:complete